jgi:fatty-acyl-CoA synthase
LQTWIRALEYTAILQDDRPVILFSLLQAVADTHGARPALLTGEAHITYSELTARANRFARWTVAQGLKKGDVLGLLMPNCPDYVATWLGVTRTGCAVALLNTNLVAEALLHSINAARSTHLIVSADLLQSVTAVADQLPEGIRVWVHGAPEPTSWPRIEPDLTAFSAAPIDDLELPLPASGERALLIYTSGTTGLPKAANVTHRRVVEWSLWFAGMMNVQPVDRLYNCLPMYHSTGGIVAIGAMLVKGGSVLIRPRFSASRFWDDIADNDCTIFQYIGELCRYLALAPPHPKERQHRLRLACGNGLQADVWTDIQQRFGLPRILEFYAATEGIVSLYNVEGKPGAIGRIPPFLANRFAVALIKCDIETLTPLRGADGGCIACDIDEPGEAIGQISSAARNFDGYTDRTASERKILRDVFVNGDLWFRTGDLLRKDAAGFFYFVDRIGDTFRWRGENVATTQVAEVLRACPGVTDAVVYGVVVPGNEGRAGMAAITTTDQFELDCLSTHLAAHLPGYAQPLFLRRTRTLDVTGTFKLTKAKLMQEGYADTTDTVWFNDRGTGRFIPCDVMMLQSIHDGSRRL